MTCHFSDLGCAFDWSWREGSRFASTNQKHYQDPGSDSSSEWNQFWISAVFLISDYGHGSDDIEAVKKISQDTCIDKIAG